MCGCIGGQICACIALHNIVSFRSCGMCLLPDQPVAIQHWICACIQRHLNKNGSNLLRLLLSLKAKTRELKESLLCVY